MLNNLMKSFDSVFFQPNENFISFINESPHLKYKNFIDAGAGMGVLTALMQDNGYDCTAYDLYPRYSTVVPVIEQDVTNLNFSFDDCVLIARPCHGEWVRTVIDYACSAGAIVLYIGVERNIPIDLEGVVSYYKVADNVGEDNENIYQCFGLMSKCKPAYQIKYEPYIKQSWRWRTERNGEPHWINGAGGGFPCTSNEEILDIKFVYYLDQLHNTDIESWSSISNNSAWVDTSGHWYSIDYADHSAFLIDCLQISEDRAEQLGFVKVSDRFLRIRAGRKPTWQQKKTLKEKGYDVKDILEW